MSDGRTADELFDLLELKEYEREALRTLLTVGNTTAPNLAEATGIPKARIYGVLDGLADRGFIEEVPGRPKTYHAKHPSEIVDRAVDDTRRTLHQRVDDMESVREVFVDEYRSAYERASEDRTPTEELFYVVDVGEPSEDETRRLYRDAEEEVNVLTKSFEYFDRIASAFGGAVERGIDVRVLFLEPSRLSEDNAAVQRESVDRIHGSYTSVAVRYSQGRLPWRGTLADPSMEYETGSAVLLVEEEDIPLHMRQAAVTENAPFVAGMKRYFDLLWEYESTAVGDRETAGG